MQLGLCCSPLQHAFAHGLAGRLERNLGITTLIVEDGSAPLPAVWEQASAAGAVLLLLDPVSAPGPVNRREWASLLEHTGAPPVALLRFGPCQYPKLLERRPFFAPANAAEAERWVERWLVELLPRREDGIDAAPVSVPVPEEWWPRLVDRPGVCLAAAEDAGAAQAFAHDAGRHFQGVFWIGCERRPAAPVLSEVEHFSRGAGRLLFILVHATGLPLDGLHGPHSYLVLEGEPAVAESGDPLAAWVGACETSSFPGSMMDLMLGRRTDWEPLVTVLDRDRRLYRPPGRFTASREAGHRHLEVLEETFRGWRQHAPLCRELSAEAAGALHRGLECSHPAARGLCLHLALFLLSEKRHAEAVAWLRTLVEEAGRESDLPTARRARMELSWLVDDAGAPRPDIALGEQLAFDFAPSEPPPLVPAPTVAEAPGP